MSNPERDDAYVAALEVAIEKIWGIARAFNLDPFPVNFELVPATIMYEFGSYGLPGRFSHWSRGKTYYRMKTEYDYGLSKIYELVVNTNPSYAFLMEQNDLLQNKVVVAHVLGHTDMFKNNVYFHHTAKNMIDKVSVNADRIRKYEYDFGIAAVERFLDAVLAIQDHIDPHVRLRQGHAQTKSGEAEAEGKQNARDYSDLWSLDTRGATDAEEDTSGRLPATRKEMEPEKDLLLFMAEHAPQLEPWQRDILLIVREEMQYFVPQMQTKTLNEGWACLVGSSLVLTERGLLRYDALHHALASGASIAVASDATARDRVTDRHARRQAATIRLHTRRGLVVEGAEEHKLSVGPDAWLALKDVEVGQTIPLTVGADCWAADYVTLPVVTRAVVPSVEDVAQMAGGGAHTVYRSMSGKTTYAQERIAAAVASVGYRFGRAAKPQHKRRFPLVAPSHVTEEFAEFLGYLTSDGNIHNGKNAIGFTSGDREMVDRYAALVAELFAIEPKVFWDDRTASGEGGRWRAVFYSTNVLELLAALGIDLYAKARYKRIPDAVLQSPKSVVSAFLRAYFDCDGCASLSGGAILSTFSDDIAQTLQVVLLNYGILSRRHGPNIGITGLSAGVFEREIGFGLARKRAKLRQYLAQHQQYKRESPTDTVVAIERGVADVYDITVDRSHQYVANGMLHHNSYWHSRIMREVDLTDAEYAEFAQMHAGVLTPSRTHLNPYYIGYRILEDIERRWDNPTEEERVKLGRLPGQGRAKLFEVRELENDVSLLRNYLTKDLIDDLDLYLYAKDGDEWVIVEKNWEKVRDGIIASMTNFGTPYITAVDNDHNGNSELLLRHHFEGQELDLAYAEKTLEHVYYIWSRPVFIDTVYEEKQVRLGYDGKKHIRRLIAGDAEE